MVVIRKMESSREKKSVRSAGLTIVAMLTVLTSIAVISGGLTGLGGITMSIAYCLLVAAPLLLVIGLAWKKTS